MNELESLKRAAEILRETLRYEPDMRVVERFAKELRDAYSRGQREARS